MFDFQSKNKNQRVRGNAGFLPAKNQNNQKIQTRDEPARRLINNQTGNQRFAYLRRGARLNIVHTGNQSGTDPVAKLDFIQDFHNQVSAETVAFFQVGNQEIKLETSPEMPQP